MGAWGIAVSSNDTYADVYGDFMDLYNDRLEVKEITERLVMTYQETINDPNDANNFWFAIAKAQWDCKQLDHQILNQVKRVIDEGSDLEVWKQLGATEKELTKRQAILQKFLETLLSEKKTAKSQKKKVIRQPVFEKGDCLTFKLANGNYGGAIVLEALYTELGHNLIALTNLNCSEKPSQKDFEKANILVRHFGAYKHSPSIHWYSPIRHQNPKHLVEKACSIPLQFDYKTENSNFGYVSDFNIWFIDMANTLLHTEKEKQSKSKVVSVRSMTKKSFWKR